MRWLAEREVFQVASVSDDCKVVGMLEIENWYVCFPLLAWHLQTHFKNMYSFLLADCTLCGIVLSAALVEDTIFCMHGGLSPDLHSMQQVQLSSAVFILLAGG